MRSPFVLLQDPERKIRLWLMLRHQHNTSTVSRARISIRFRVACSETKLIRFNFDVPFRAEAADAHDNCTNADGSDDDDRHDDENCQHTTYTCTQEPSLI